MVSEFVSSVWEKENKQLIEKPKFEIEEADFHLSFNKYTKNGWQIKMIKTKN